MAGSAAARIVTPVPSFVVHSRVDIREWYVSAGHGEPVGPVSTELVARGIAAGKVPRTAYVARVGEVFWQDVLDVPEIVSALKSLQA
jgi:hypothetical protein